MSQAQIAPRESARDRSAESGGEHRRHRDDDGQRGDETKQRQSRPAPDAKRAHTSIPVLAGNGDIGAPRDDPVLEEKGSQRERDEIDRQDCGAGQINRPFGEPLLDAGDQNEVLALAPERGGRAVFFNRHRKDEQEACGEPGQGQRQGDAPEGVERAGAERARRLYEARPDGGQRARNGEIDDGEKMQSHNCYYSPEGEQKPSGVGAEGLRHEAAGLERHGPCKRADVGRHHERDQEQKIPEALGWQVSQRAQHGQRRGDNQAPRTHPEAKPHRIGQKLRQARVGIGGPDCAERFAQAVLAEVRKNRLQEHEQHRHADNRSQTGKRNPNDAEAAIALHDST